MKLKKIILYILPTFIVLLLWEWISRKGPVDQVLFPPPSEVIISWINLVKDNILLPDIEVSLKRLVFGLVIGGTVAVISGLLTGRIKKIHNIITPFIQAIRPLPAVAIIPLVIVWLGIGDTAKIFTIAFGSFFPIWLNTHVGAEQIPKIFLWSARLLKLSPFKLFFKVILPAALPFILAGVRTGAATAYAMVFVSELAGASSGIGYRVAVAQSVYRTDQMMAALVTLGILGALTDLLIVFTSKKLTPWIKHHQHEPNYH
ncbi:MAG TPA: ABC transporter permease [Candidatus Magasanikbacteria bacterium]|nr:ABC transporter permease [Candidatus Magasanikbacteria bacterium]